MAANADDENVPNEFRLQLLMNKQKLEYKLEKRKQMQEIKYKHELEAQKLIEETKRQREIEETKRQLQYEIEETKRKKLKVEFDSSSLKKSRKLLIDHADFYTIHVGNNLKRFDINDLLKDNDYFNDNTLTYIQDSLNNSACHGKTTENLIQAAFYILIVDLLNTFSNATSLKCLNTSSSGYLQDKFRPDCTFIYKNIHINIKTQKQILEDFVVLVGDLKAPDVRLTDRAAMGQILQYLKVLLDVQQRQKIYGFLCNFKHLKYFYVEKLSSNSYEYFQSQELELFISMSDASSSSTGRSGKKIRSTENLIINTDSWKILGKFLTMNYKFYEYRRLNIDPSDDFVSGQYMITKRLGNGLTSTVYLLEKIKRKSSVKTLSCYVIKILTNNSYAKYFSAEMKITKQLKKFNNSKKFNLYFQDIVYSLSSEKYLFFKKELQLLESLSLEQSKQLIESLSLEQSKQLIDVVHYLYNCRVIRRDTRPRNVMLDYDTNHIKLIDFDVQLHTILMIKQAALK
ncbi:unnamed protein product [Rotaria magnacalcarata]|uniref:Protein kinase domain-containing protein n=1 Tax=Rotaria magnacalcarata TaxID=392030 RepID=A0A816RBV0_9BILA|nr:unnamed protein product [Rotaria magnacalcarata]CAF4194615.1 unnamed protein product [Rotaria magnacalcarata]